ncbi:MAG TPA: amidohydrolase family protein [Xanthobacteraceae bacterium]|nr:amidohydrolase family protein [Xanthobacteraceae bacterium]
MMPDEVTIESVALPDRTGAFRVTLRDGSIGAIRPAEQTGEATWLALPGFANLHAHADRAYTVQSFRPRSLADAVAAAAAARALFTAADVAARATQLFERSVGHGVVRIRTHTDVDPVVEMRSMEGVLAAKQRMGERLDVDVIAFSTSKSDLAEPQALDRLKQAVAMGADLIGASLNASADPSRALESLFDLAEQSGLPVDLHLDEHLEPDHMLAGMVADAIIARGLQGRVTLSHLCVLAALGADAASALIEKFARADVTVAALPAANLFLQDRGEGSPNRRGVTLMRELIAAGVPVRCGTDNTRDWFYPFGDGDMLETALFAAVAGHLDESADLVGAICGGRRTIAEGGPADLVLLAASSLDDALARRPADRVVFKAGRQVAGPALAGTPPRHAAGRS